MDVLAIDIGSSAVKGCLFKIGDPDVAPELLRVESIACPLLRPLTGRAEHDLTALETALGKICNSFEAETLSFTSAMHGLVLLDSQGNPLTNAISWADGRSASQAEALKQRDPEAQHRTGTPIHPMAWPAKIDWLRENESALWSRTEGLTDLKSFLIGRLIDRQLPLELSSASGTGLWNRLQGDWDPALTRDLEAKLPKVITTTEPLEWNGRSIYLGGADGPLGNLGVGAVEPGDVAVSLGTSGALREPAKSTDQLPDSLFCYAVSKDLWVRGGAISNGTSVLDWLRKVSGWSLEETLCQVESGDSKGLRVYPYFSGERAPFWRPNVQSHISGWSFEHGLQELARAAVEGVAFCLKRILGELTDSQKPLRCTGGFFASDFWCQLLADVTGRPVARSSISEATALGAALLTLPDYQTRSSQLAAGRIWEPRQAEHTHYSELYNVWAEGDPEASQS